MPDLALVHYLKARADLAAATADLERWLGGESQPLLESLGKDLRQCFKEIDSYSWMEGHGFHYLPDFPALDWKLEMYHHM